MTTSSANTHGNTETVLTVEELADRWKVSARTVSRMLQKGELPHFQIGRQIRIRLSDILAYEKNKMR